MLKRRKLSNCIRVFLTFGYSLLVAFPLVVSAAQVTLQWDANNPAPDGFSSGTDSSQVPSNTPPDRPMLSEPADGATGVDLMPILMIEPFVDADQDGHARTRYQIALCSNWDSMNSAEFVFDGEFTQQLTSLPIGDLILDPETTYYWRVRYYDDRNGASAWSASRHFTTTDNISAGFPDDDGDGILNEQEVANENISPDLGATGNMMVVGTCDPNNPQLALMNANSSSTDVVAVRATDAEGIEIGSSANRPAVLTGLLSFKLRLLGDQTTANLTVCLSVPAPSNTIWYNYDIETGWVPSTNVSFSSDRKSVTIYLVDGGTGDNDGIQNGVIVDSSGLGYRATGSLGYSSQTISVSNSSDSSGGGCFISLPMNDMRGDGNSTNLPVIFGLLGVALFTGTGIARRK
jgi:chitinase